MTEAEWLTGEKTYPLIHFVQDVASDRKLRLAAAAYCRHMWFYMGPASRRAVEFGEELADGVADESKRSSIVGATIQAVLRYTSEDGEYDAERWNYHTAADMAYRVPCNNGLYAIKWTIGNYGHLPGGAALIRDIFGNPFRPLSPASAYPSPNVVDLAGKIYDHRTFDLMPALADALEKAGCTDAAILDHCRSQTHHVRGCWVVDGLLGKH